MRIDCAKYGALNHKIGKFIIRGKCHENWLVWKNERISTPKMTETFITFLIFLINQPGGTFELDVDIADMYITSIHLK